MEIFECHKVISRTGHIKQILNSVVIKCNIKFINWALFKWEYFR